jgi:metallo-beta-lactamase family protein
MDDVENAMLSFVGLQYDKSFQIFPGVDLTFRDAGHILGSASILLEINENGKRIRFGFSGDIGRTGAPIIRDPNLLRDLDVLIMESTYGNREHGKTDDELGELAELIREVERDGGKIIIPAFAVGRTQLLVYMLHKLYDQNRIPNLPIYVDSPMACNATDIFRSHPECFDRETYRIFLEDGEDPFGFGRLRYIRSVNESKKLNELNESHIIISASGMAEGGRILHHLRNNIHNPKNLVLFVGYAAQHTLARKIMDGEEIVRIFGEKHRLRCKVKKMDYFSAHADRKGLLDYVKPSSPKKLKKIFLVHGEEEQAMPLYHALRSKGYQSVQYPAPGEEYAV